MTVRPVRVLQFAVLNRWVVDNLEVLGNRRQRYHLAYQPSQIDPDVVAAIKEGALVRGAPIEILKIDGDRAVKVATAELDSVRIFSGYLRFDFSLRSVDPQARRPRLPYPPEAALCRFA